MIRKSDALKILVVDDSAYNRKLISTILLNMENVDSVTTASNGEEAIKQVLADPPDVITLDLDMPRMDGFTFLRWLMRNHPLPVVVVSAMGGEKNVFKALDLGALEFVVKPDRHASVRIVKIESELHEKIRAVAKRDMSVYLNSLQRKKEPTKPSLMPKVDGESVGVMIVGASTGGPSAIQGIISRLPEDFPYPVIVVQHMPPVFTRQFAIRLDKTSPLRATEAQDGDKLAVGRVLVVPGGYHLDIRGRVNHHISLKESVSRDRYVPSINITMSSAADVYGDRSIGVLLTGMGNDGAEGLLCIRRAGGRTIVESEETSVVFGMPRAAIQKKAAEWIVDLDRVPDVIMKMVREISGLKKSRGDDTN